MKPVSLTLVDNDAHDGDQLIYWNFYRENGVQMTPYIYISDMADSEGALDSIDTDFGWFFKPDRLRYRRGRPVQLE